MSRIKFSLGLALLMSINAANVLACDHAEQPRLAADVPEPRFTVEEGASPQRGARSAPVTIVVFSDFECPFCQRASVTMKAIEQTYGDKVRFVFKHRPLPFHPHARRAAQLAVAAQEQGRFWELHDALFDTDRKLSDGVLRLAAEKAGVQVPSSADEDRLDAQIAADVRIAEAVGARGTPTFFINGRRLMGAQPMADFSRAIDEELGAQ